MLGLFAELGGRILTVPAGTPGKVQSRYGRTLLGTIPRLLRKISRVRIRFRVTVQQSLPRVILLIGSLKETVSPFERLTRISDPLRVRAKTRKEIGSIFPRAP